jgi:hypothetical protein
MHVTTCRNIRYLEHLLAEHALLEDVEPSSGQTALLLAISRRDVEVRKRVQNNAPQLVTQRETSFGVPLHNQHTCQRPTPLSGCACPYLCRGCDDAASSAKQQRCNALGLPTSTSLSYSLYRTVLAVTCRWCNCWCGLALTSTHAVPRAI